MVSLNSKQHKVLEEIFSNPMQADILWSDIEKLCLALGGTVKEGAGSRVKLFLNGAIGLFHRPHPSRHTYKSALLDVRKFFINAGAWKNGI